LGFLFNVSIYAQEVRGIWITNVASNVLSSCKTIHDAMNKLSNMGINVVFPVVWNSGYTLFPSQTMYKYFYDTYSTYDQLQQIITEGHRVGIEVIPWFEYGFMSYYGSPGRILQKYPHWAARTKTGDYCTQFDNNGSPTFYWMNPFHDSVQTFMNELILEVLKKYDVDGVQGDDRLPALPVSGGYDAYTVNLYKNENNGNTPPTNEVDNNWIKWRADKLTNYLKKLRDSVKSISNDLVFSSSPTPYSWGYYNYLQDSKYWVENNIVDHIIPQLYRYNINDYKASFDNTVFSINSNVRSKIYAGIIARSGSWNIDYNLLKQEVAYNRANGIKGESYFFYEAINYNNIYDSLKNGLYKNPSLLPWRNGKIWRPKALVIHEDDPVNVTKTGTWVKKTGSTLGSKNDAVLEAGDGALATIEYNFIAPYSAWYGAYAYIETSFNFQGFKKAKYYLIKGNDTTIVLFDQTDKNRSCFQKLSNVYLNAGQTFKIVLTNEGLTTGKKIYADAVMLMIDRKLTKEDVVGVENDNKDVINYNPSNFIVETNYPNPFNPETNIRFFIPENNIVKMNVYNILGQKILSVYNDYLKSGWHNFAVNMNNFSSGTYFCIIEWKQQRKAIKLQLLK